MWFPKRDLVQSADEGSAFLLLAWQEMFDPITPDSYQPRLSHSASLVTELGETATKASSSEKWLKHVRVIQNELEAVAEAEAPILQRLPRYAWTLRQLVSTSQSARKIACLVKILEEQNQQYSVLASEVLQESAANLPKGKCTAVDALRRWATVAVQANRTPAQLSQVATEENLRSKPEAILALLLEAAKAKSQEFECVLAVQGKPNMIQSVVRKVGFNPRSKDHFNEPDFLKLLPADSVLVSCTINADSPDAAAKMAVRQLRDATDIFNFYSNSFALSVQPVALVLDRSTRLEMCVQLGEPSLRKLRPRRKAADLAHKVLDRVPRDRLNGRILNALEHYSLAHSSAAARVQLVNLWSAMECLVGSEDAESVIGNVCKTVSPIVVFRRADKLLTYLAISLHQSRSAGVGQPLGPGFPASTNTYVSREELILTLSKPKDHPDIVALLNFAAWHPLLVNRIYTLWQTFSDPKVLSKALRLSHQRLDWHLHRIYRARNLIVHEGVDVPTVGFLLDNLHYYFSITLARILHGMVDHADWGIRECIAHWNARSGYTLAMLEANPSCLTVGDFFVSPHSLENVPVWKATATDPKSLNQPPT